jgi:hypothetical protein
MLVVVLEVLVTVGVSTIFWGVTPCSLAEVYRRFCQDRGKRFFRNVGKFLTDYSSQKMALCSVILFQFQPLTCVFIFYNQNFVTLLENGSLV